MSEDAVDVHNRAVRGIGLELAVLCEIRTLMDDMPGTADSFIAVYDVLTNAIDDILDRDMAVDPIEHAIVELAKPEKVQGLETLAFAMLRRRNDHGEWSAR